MILGVPGAHLDLVELADPSGPGGPTKCTVFQNKKRPLFPCAAALSRTVCVCVCLVYVWVCLTSASGGARQRSPSRRST